MGQHGHRNMFYATGLPGWMRFGYSPGWGGMPPGAQYLQQTGQLPQAMNWIGQQAGTAQTQGTPQPAQGTQTPPAQGTVQTAQGSQVTPQNTNLPAPQPQMQMQPPMQPTRDQEIQILEEQLGAIENQINQIKDRIEQLKG